MRVTACDPDVTLDLEGRRYGWVRVADGEQVPRAWIPLRGMSHEYYVPMTDPIWRLDG